MRSLPNVERRHGRGNSDRFPYIGYAASGHLFFISRPRRRSGDWHAWGGRNPNQLDGSLLRGASLWELSVQLASHEGR